MSDERHPPAAEADLLAERCPVSYAIFTVARVHKAIAASRLAELGLYPNQEIMLMQLGAGDGLSQKTLAETLRISHVTVNKSVARMEQSGWVRRQSSEQDRRITLVYLTDRGRELQEQILTVWTDLEEATSRYLSATEAATFTELSAKIRRSLDEASSPTDYQPG